MQGWVPEIGLFGSLNILQVVLWKDFIKPSDYKIWSSVQIEKSWVGDQLELS